MAEVEVTEGLSTLKSTDTTSGRGDLEPSSG